MKYSIKKQIAGIFIGLMAATFLLCWFINVTFLEEYYTKNREKALFSAYEQIMEANRKNFILTDEFDIELQKICSKYNIEVLILDAKSQIIKSSSSRIDVLKKQLFDNIFERIQPDTNIIEETDAYVMQNVVDPRTKTEFIEIWGMFEDSKLFLMRTALESIRDSVGIANRFLAYVGICAVIIGGIVIYFISQKVTQPILELAEISNRMAHLDFDVKYKGTSKSELALLGNHINQLSETLEKTISELKTANLELQKDIEKKTEIDEMRKEFISNVSHELKTPIALIQGYAEGLLDGIHEEESSKDFYCEVIIDEASKMNDMVKKLLTLNQLEAGYENVKLERFDLVNLIHSSMQSVSILAKQNEIHLVMKPYEPTFVWADEFQVEEVVRNYLSNAINHADGEKLVEITIRESEGKVIVNVFNTGKPIPEESLARLWDKFYKVDKARTREYGGSGVGLSIVKAIMERMQQKYWVTNYPNGVAFSFELESVQP